MKQAVVEARRKKRGGREGEEDERRQSLYHNTISYTLIPSPLEPCPFQHAVDHQWDGEKITIAHDDGSGRSHR